MLAPSLALLLAAAVPGPLFFEANAGQAPPDVLAQARAGAITLEVTHGGLRVRSGRDATTLAFHGGRAEAVRFEAPLAAPVRIVHGGRAVALTAAERVVLPAVWPGIDVVLRARDGRLAFDLVVAPGARPEQVSFVADGPAAIDARGALTIAAPTGKLALSAPVASQQVGGAASAVPSRWVARGARVSFAVDEYDRRHPLVIDPVVEYASYVPVPNTARLATDGTFVYVASAYSTAPLAADPQIEVIKLDVRQAGMASLVWSTRFAGNAPGAGGVTFIADFEVSSTGRLLVCGSQTGAGARAAPFIDTDRLATMPSRYGAGVALVISADGQALEHVTSFGDSGVSTCAWAPDGASFYTSGRSDVGTPWTSQIPGMTGWGFLVQTTPDDDPATSGDDVLFSSRLGVNSTLGRELSVDPSGTVTLLFSTSNQTGPDVDQWVNMSSFQSRNDEVAICKFATALGANALLGCTYVGGTGIEGTSSITTDALGRVYVWLHNGSADFPVPAGGPTPIVGGLTLTRLSSNLGSQDLAYFFPENIFAAAVSVAVAADGSIAVLSAAGGGSWPFTSCVLRSDNVGSNFAVLDPTATRATFATRLPGLNGSGVRTLADGRVAVLGGAQFQSVFDPYVNGLSSAPSGAGVLVMATRSSCVDLALSGLASATLLTQGDTVGLTFEVTHAGVEDATGVVVDVAIPANLDVLDATTNLGTCTTTIAGRVRCRVGDLALTATAAVQITALAARLGAGAVAGTVTTDDIDLVPMNDHVSLGLNVGPPAGPCGAVSSYGECMGDTLRICVGRSTPQEALTVTDCAAMSATCRAARGVTPAACVPIASTDAGLLEADAMATPDAGESATDAGASSAPDASGAVDAAVRADAAARADADAETIIPTPSPGCGCATPGPLGGEPLLALLAIAWLRRRLGRR